MPCWHPHIPFPLHQTFHPWSSKEALDSVPRNAQNFLLTHPRVAHMSGTGLVEDIALCGASSVSLTFQVGSSRMVVAHLVCSAQTPEHKGAPIMGWWERVHSDGGLMSIWSACSPWDRRGCLQQSGTPLHTVPPPTSFLPFSFLCRCWLYPRPGHLVPVKWH